MIDLAIAQQLFNLNGAVSLAFLDLDDRSSAAATAARIRKRLPGVEVSTAAEWVESYGQLVVVEDFARFLALLALVIAGLGVSNVLHVSVGERNPGARAPPGHRLEPAANRRDTSSPRRSSSRSPARWPRSRSASSCSS